VDDPLKALGMAWISKSQASRLCGEIDEQVQTFLTRPLEGEWPDIWPNATNVKTRRDHRIASAAVSVVVVVNTGGRREVLEITARHSEAEPLWVEFLHNLARRGLRCVKLVTADAHEGLRAAIRGAECDPAALPDALQTQYSGLCRQDTVPHHLSLGRHHVRPGRRNRCPYTMA